MFVAQLVYLVKKEGVRLDTEQKASLKSIEDVLSKSSSRTGIKIKEVGESLKSVLEAAKTNSQEAVDKVVQKDLTVVDGKLLHFVNDVQHRQFSLPNGPRHNNAHNRARARGQAHFLQGIEAINKEANQLCLKANIKQLKLRQRSFTANRNSASENPTVGSLLNKVADWPGSDLNKNLTLLLETAGRPGSDEFKDASRNLLQALAEQESILSLVGAVLTNEKFTSTIESKEERDKLRALGENAKELLSKFDNPDSPFARLKKLAVVGYRSPDETSGAVAVECAKLRGSLPPNSLAPVNVPVPSNLPPVPYGPPPPLPPTAVNGHSPGSAPGALPAGANAPPAMNGASAAGANVPPIPVNGVLPGQSTPARALPSVPQKPLAAVRQSTSVLQPGPVNNQPPATTVPPPNLAQSTGGGGSGPNAQSAQVPPAVPSAISLTPPKALPPDDPHLSQSRAGNLSSPPKSPPPPVPAGSMPPGNKPPTDDPPPPALLPQPSAGVVQQSMGQQPGNTPSPEALSLPANGPTAPAKLPPLVHYGVLPPNDVPPLAGEPTKPRRESSGQLTSIEKAQVAELLADFDLPRLPEDEPLLSLSNPLAPPSVLDSAELSAEFMNSLAKAPGDVYLAVSKVEGDGYRVVNNKGKVLYLKVEERKGHHMLDQLNPHRYRQIKKAKRALRALVENAEHSGLIEGAKLNKGALRLGNELTMKWAKSLFGAPNIPSEVSTHAMDLINEQAAQDESRKRRERLEKLHAKFEESASTKPNLSVSTIVADNWLSIWQNDQRQHILDEIKVHFKKKEDGQSIHPDVPSASSAARRSDFVDKMLVVKQLGDETGKWVEMIGAEFYKRIEPWTSPVRGPGGEIQRPEVVLDNMMKFAVQTPALVMNVGDSIKQLVGLSAPTESETKFKLKAELVGPQIFRYFDQLQVAAELFTNEQFLEQVPNELRKRMAKLGKAMEELAGAVLDPQGPFVAVYRLAEAAVAAPGAVRAEIFQALLTPPSDLPPPPDRVSTLPSGELNATGAAAVA